METKHQFLRVAYELISHRDGVAEDVEKATREQPFSFITGFNFTLDTFENNLKDLKKGDTFDFVIPSAEAYGDYDPDHVQDFDREVFTIDGKFDSTHIFNGNIVEMMRADGSPILGTVKEVTPMKVVMDFNHPLAGENLHYKGEVKVVRDATEEELNPHHGCCGCGSHGCGDSGCGDGCCDGCNGGCN